MEGTNELVVESYKNNLTCDYRTDKLYKKETEDSIRKLGKEKYIEVETTRIAESKLLLGPIASYRLSEDEVIALILLAKETATTEAALAVLKSQAD